MVYAHGVAIVQTVWAMSSDLRRGRRETRTERIADELALRGALAELVPLISLPNCQRREPRERNAAADLDRQDRRSARLADHWVTTASLRGAGGGRRPILGAISRPEGLIERLALLLYRRRLDS